MKKFISYLIIIVQSFLMISMVHAQYAAQSKPLYGMLSTQGITITSPTGQIKGHSLVIIYKYESNETIWAHTLDLAKKCNCIMKDSGWAINDDMVKALQSTVHKRVIFNEISLYHSVLKISKAKPHYLLYFLEKEYPHWKTQKTSIKTLGNFIKIKVNINDGSHDIMKIMYRNDKV